MSRLIDADKLIKDLKVQFDAVYREDGKLLYSDHVIIGEDVDAIIELVNSQPIAYDIDKVTDELKDKYYSCDLESYEVDGSEYEDGRFDAYNDAIEIVKKGGAE